MSRDELRRLRQKERARRRRRKKIITYCVIAFLVIALGIVLSLTVFFKTETVAVAGDEIYNNEQIVEASGLKIGESMFLFDKDKVSDAIEGSLPYVENATIKRSLTGVVTISITAAKATLAVDMGDSYVLINSSGKVLEDGVMTINDDVAIIIASNVTSASPGLLVQFENPTDLETILTIEKIIKDNELTGINSINITNYSNIKLGYNQRITLEIGSSSSLQNKISFIKATVTKLDKDEPLFEGTVDFTIDSKAYINEKEETTTVPVTTEPTSVVA